MKFSLNYHQQNFINAFLKKMTVKYLFELYFKKLLTRNFQKSFKMFFSTYKYFMRLQLFLNYRFLRKFSVTVDMVWLYKKKYVFNFWKIF